MSEPSKILSDVFFELEEAFDEKNLDFSSFTKTIVIENTIFRRTLEELEEVPNEPNVSETNIE